MEKLVYTPDKDVKVHEEGAIRLLCRHFQSHEAGLPEWLKNSADAYAREDAPETKRDIFVIFNNGRKGQPQSISCLDFSGMTSSVIEDNFRIWADPEAALAKDRAITVQGGHGNGGKCYMTHMFLDHSFIYTVKEDRGCLYGVTGGSIKFGYVPDREQGRDFHVDNYIVELDKALKGTGCPLYVLQKVASEAIRMSDGFTLLKGVGPKGYRNRIPTRHLIDSLQDHPQMIQTLEMCNVFIVIDGKLYNHGRKLCLPNIKPMEGEEKPLVIMIPETLLDPLSEEEVSTTEDGKQPQGALILKTSQASMRYKKKVRHNIIYKARSGYIGYTPIPEFDVRSSYSAHIYGECECLALENFKQNDRADLANSPETRAVRQFISEQIQQYAEKFEARDKRRYDKEEKNAISQMNDALDQWKNKFLDEMFRGMWGHGGDTGGPEPRPALPSGKVDRIELSLPSHKSGLGISLRPRLKFYDADNRRVRAVPFRWISEDNNVAMVDEDLMIINTFSYGKTTIHAETLDGSARSETVPLEVVRILDITIVPSEVELAAGSRQKLEAVCKLENDEEVKNVLLEWLIDNRNVAAVSSFGTVFGFTPGETSVIAADDKCESKDPATIKVVLGSGKDRGDKRGKGFPTVLVSGEIDQDPDTHEYRHFSQEEPPVVQHAEDAQRNIWWINSKAPMAELYLDVNKGYGYQSQAWRMYHIERYIDVIVQIALVNDPEERESISINDWIMKWGAQVTNIQTAVRSDLFDFIAAGVLPEL